MSSACGPFTEKTNKQTNKNKNLKEQEIHDIFIGTKQIKLALKMTWLMEILRISLEEQTSIT